MQASLDPGEIGYGFVDLPDQAQDIGPVFASLAHHPSYDEFLSKLENRNNIPRSYTFMARTFLYLGYSDVSGLPFTPDTARVSVIEQICEREEDLRGKLLNTLHESIKKRPLPRANAIWDAV